MGFLLMRSIHHLAVQVAQIKILNLLDHDSVESSPQKKNCDSRGYQPIGAIANQRVTD
jgi:hypothetical protein